jgi:hypothetical protein
MTTAPPRTMVLLTNEEIERLADATERPPRLGWFRRASEPTVADLRRARELRSIAAAVRMAEEAKSRTQRTD